MTDGDSTGPFEATDWIDPLTDETRRRILKAANRLTGGDPVGVTFTELRREAGVEDPGRFNYHVGQLVGTYLRHDGERYRLRQGSHGVALGLAACGRSAGSPTWTAETDHECPHCDRRVEAVYTDYEVLLLNCAEHGEAFFQEFPPSLTDEDPEIWVGAAVRRQHHWTEWCRRGRCPRCFGELERALAYGRLTYAHDSGRPEDATPLWGGHRCEHCGCKLWYPLGISLAACHEVRRAFDRAGVDVRAEPFPNRYVVERTITAGEGQMPDRARLGYRIGDRRLDLSVTADLAVSTVDRS